MSEILKFDDPVVLIGGADIDMALLRSFSQLPLVAADGGANNLRNSNVVPGAIVGDIDSLKSREYWQGVTRVIEVAEQDTTDLEKCLYSIAAPAYIAMGFLGGRTDHTLVSLHVAQKYHPQKPVLLLGSEDLLFVCNSSISLPVPVGVCVSIYPLTRVQFVSSQGLQYPLDGLAMQQGTFIGTSNCSCEDQITIDSDSGIFALILPLSCLSNVLALFAN